MAASGLHVVQIPRRFERSSWGGTETMVLETSRRLLARGHHAEILSSLALSTRREEVMGGVPVRRVGYFYPYLGLSDEARARLDHKGGNLFSFEALRRLALREELDLIHLHTGNRLGGIARTVARGRRIPYLISIHGGCLDVPEAEAASWTAPTRGALDWGKVLGLCVGSRRVLEDAAAVLCVGPEEQRRLAARLPRTRILHLPNGVDPHAFAAGDGAAFRARLGIPLEAPVLLCVGRIDPQKNQGLAVDVLAALGDRQPQVHLVLVGPEGDAAFARALTRQAADAGLAGRVHAVGQLPPGGKALADAYHGADVLLLPSVHEPFGIVILEAWSAGLPVVASRVGGVPSFVEDGVDGLLADPADPTAWVQAVDRLLASPARREALGAAGRAKAVSQYSWDRITDQLERIYTEVIDEDPVRP